jgi:hypothetical protein
MDINVKISISKSGQGGELSYRGELKSDLWSYRGKLKGDMLSVWRGLKVSSCHIMPC